MDEPVELTMPDGTVIWARVEGAAQAAHLTAGQGGGAADVSFPWPGRDRADDRPSTLANFVETVKSVAASVHDAVVSQAPSGVSVEFGLELSVQTGQFVAVLAQAGAKTSVTVRLEWDREALAAGRAGQPGPDAASADGAAARVPRPAAEG